MTDLNIFVSDNVKDWGGIQFRNSHHSILIQDP